MGARGMVASDFSASQARLEGPLLSRTIGLARITLIIGLVFLHYDAFPGSTMSPFAGMDPNANPIATFVNSFVLFFFFAVVPLLSAVSGWLFFSFKSDAANALFTRIVKRAWTLYLPLVAWNAFFLLLMASIYVLNHDYPLLAHLNLDFGDARPGQFVNAVFAITGKPIAFQFWFVRDLFVSVLVSPILWLGITRAPLLMGVVLGAAWLSDFNLWIFFRTDVVFFFFLGGLARVHDTDVTLSWRATAIAFVLYCGIVALRAAAPLYLDIADAQTREIVDMATRFMRLAGVVAAWGLIQHAAATRWGAVASGFGGLAFFLHAVHYPLLEQVKLWLWPLVPAGSDGFMLLHYAVSVAVTVVTGVALGVVISRATPRIFALMNGGRMLAPAG